MTRQEDAHRGALSRRGVDIDAAVVLTDDGKHRGQSQAGARTRALGGVEGLEQPVAGRLVHAGAVVGDAEQHEIAGRAVGADGRVGSVQADGFGGDGDPAGAGDGVTGVDTEVGEDLVELRGVHAHRPDLLAGLPDQVDVLADEAAEHLQGGVHTAVQIEHLRVDRLPPGKGEYLAGDLGGAGGGVGDLREIGVQGGVGRHLVQGDLRIAEDDTQHVVEIVRHAPGQPADGLHLLAVEELVLQSLPFRLDPLAFGHVPADAAQPLKAAVRSEDRHAADLDDALPAVGVHQRHLQRGERLAVDDHCLDPSAEFVRTVVGQQVERRAAEEPLGRIAAHFLAFPAEKGVASFGVHLPDEVAGGLHQGAIALLARP